MVILSRSNRKKAFEFEIIFATFFRLNFQKNTSKKHFFPNAFEFEIFCFF